VFENQTNLIALDAVHSAYKKTNSLDAFKTIRGSQTGALDMPTSIQTPCSYE